MKKLLALLLAMLLCLALVACGDSDKKDDDKEDSSSAASSAAGGESDPSDTTDAADVTEAPAEYETVVTSDGAFEGTLEDYLNTEDGQMAMEDMMAGMESNDACTVECYAQGNTMIIEATLTQEYTDDQIAIMKPYLEEQLDSEEMTSQANEAIANMHALGFSDAAFKVIYKELDGTVIAERTYY